MSGKVRWFDRGFANGRNRRSAAIHWHQGEGPSHPPPTAEIHMRRPLDPPPWPVSLAAAPAVSSRRTRDFREQYVVRLSGYPMTKTDPHHGTLPQAPPRRLCCFMPATKLAGT